MNWYKISQQYYTDIGHDFSYTEKSDQPSILWTCKKNGDNFRFHEAYSRADDHYEVFGNLNDGNYWGRHDPAKNAVSISTKVDDEIPNRIINRLMSEFPGAKIFAFTRDGVTQII